VSVRVVYWLIFIFTGVGAALLLFSLYGFLREALIWAGKPRGILSRASAMAARADIEGKRSFWMGTEFPWLTAYLIATPVFFLLWFALEGMSFQLMSFLVFLAPLLVRSWILRQKRREAANEIRQFLVELRLQLSSGGTLRPALQAVAQYGPLNLGRILRNRLASQESGPEVLRRLAEDTGSRWLADVAGRAEAAQEGMLNLDEAVTQSIQRVTEDMDTEVREELQRIPTRLVVIVAPLLLGPALALLVFPVVARTIASLEGVTFFGSF
jgi:hypothetical protein